MDLIGLLLCAVPRTGRPPYNKLVELKPKDGRLVLTVARGPMLWYFLICAGFSVIGTVTIKTGEWVPWMILIFFGLGTGVFGIALIPGSSYLELNPEGFCVCSLFRRQYWPWKSIETFRVGWLSNKNIVMFDIVLDQPRTKLQIANQKHCGCDGALTVDYGIDVYDLAKTMNEWRERAIRSSLGKTDRRFYPG